MIPTGTCSWGKNLHLFSKQMECGLLVVPPELAAVRVLPVLDLCRLFCWKIKKLIFIVIHHSRWNPMLLYHQRAECTKPRSFLKEYILPAAALLAACFFTAAAFLSSWAKASHVCNGHCFHPYILTKGTHPYWQRQWEKTASINIITSLQNSFLRHLGWRLLHRLVGFGFLQKAQTISTWMLQLRGEYKPKSRIRGEFKVNLAQIKYHMIFSHYAESKCLILSHISYLYP